MLELNPDGTFRFRTVVILVARQNGKTTLMQVVSLWRMYVDGAALIIGTAQNLDVAEEAWAATVELAEGVPELASEIKHVDRTNGKKALRLQTGERYKVAASSRRGGRGLSGDLALLDELREHQSWSAWSAVSKTTLAKRRAQIVGLSNAGDARSVVLHHLRKRAIAAIDQGRDDVSLGLFEWSAPDDAELDDRQAWAMANPSLGYTITEAAIENALETDDEEVFKTEVLCQWVEGVTTPLIPLDEWAALEDLDSTLLDPVYFGVDINPTRTRAGITAVGKSDTGRRHVEPIDIGDGTDWLLSRLVSLCKRHPESKPVLDPAISGSLIPGLTKAGIDFEAVTGAEYIQACGAFYDAVGAGELVHLGDSDLDDAVEAARAKKVGERFKWTHAGGEGDVVLLVAATLAHWVALRDAENDYDVLDSIL